MKYIRLLAIIAVLTLVLSGCNVSVTSTGSGYPGATVTTGSSGPSGPTGAEPNWGVQAKTSGCVAHNGLADSACTPGAIFPQATKDVICQSGYTRTVRNVPFSEKQQVYAEYGIYSHAAGQYEVDHLVPLELGGSNDIANLWPEAASPQPGFHQKDQVENYLHDQMCSGAVTLKDAQIEIATNWLAVYDRMPKA